MGPGFAGKSNLGSMGNIYIYMVTSHLFDLQGLLHDWWIQLWRLCKTSRLASDPFHLDASSPFQNCRAFAAEMWITNGCEIGASTMSPLNPIFIDEFLIKTSLFDGGFQSWRQKWGARTNSKAGVTGSIWMPWMKSFLQPNQVA